MIKLQLEQYQIYSKRSTMQKFFILIRVKKETKNPSFTWQETRAGRASVYVAEGGATPNSSFIYSKVNFKNRQADQIGITKYGILCFTVLRICPSISLFKQNSLGLRLGEWCSNFLSLKIIFCFISSFQRVAETNF